MDTGFGVGVGWDDWSPQSFSSDGATRHSHLTAFSSPGSMRFSVVAFPEIVCADTLVANIADETKSNKELAAPGSMALSFILILPLEAKRK